VELANWRAIFAAPGIAEAQKKDLMAVVDNAVRTRNWQDLLAKNGWTDMYLPGDQFKHFLEQEIRQTEKVINSLGLGGKK
jgi:putative tricarboxylic transport membrane protein